MNIASFQPAFALALVLAASGACAAGKATTSQAQRDYQQERARCLKGDSGQARETCLKEAGAAYDEARRGRLAPGAAGDLQRNATQRCDAQPAADRAACMERIKGAGNTQGSVKDGGVIRSTETPVK